MKRLEIIDSFGDKIVLEPELFLCVVYDFMENKMPGLGIQFYSYDEDGYREPYATLTKNFGEFIGAKNCAYIDTNNNSFTAQLLEMGFCQDTGLTKPSGFCTYPLWKFDTDFLKEIDVHGLYDTYEKKFDKYMEKGADVPIRYREVEIITDVVEALGVECKIDPDSDGLVVWANDNVYYRGEFYQYLLTEVCEYEENGAVKGLPLDLCHDFYDLCEYNKVNYMDYNKPKTQENTEYVITMSSGGGTTYDFMTCSSREEAEQVCENYEWVFVDENEFEWSLDIDEREKVFALSDDELCFIDDEEKMVDFVELSKEEFLASYSYLTEEEYDATKRVFESKNNDARNISFYEVQLGRVADGAKDGDVDYESPQIILVEADHYIGIEEVERIFSEEIKSFDCNCVYGITPVEDWELKEYECYKTTPKYKLGEAKEKNTRTLDDKLVEATERSGKTDNVVGGKDEFLMD